MEKKIFFQYKIIDNSESIEHDVGNYYYHLLCINPEGFDVILYKKIFVLNGRTKSLTFPTLDEIKNFDVKIYDSIPFWAIEEIEEYSKKYPDCSELWPHLGYRFYTEARLKYIRGVLNSKSDEFEIVPNPFIKHINGSNIFEVNLEAKFLEKLKVLKTKDVQGFLNYHYDRYKNEKIEFIDLLKNLLVSFPYQEYDTFETHNKHFLGEIYGNSRENYLATMNWIDNKRAEVFYQQIDKQKPKKGEETTRNQQILILYYLELFHKNLGLTSAQLREFLAILLNKSPDNIKKSLGNDFLNAKSSNEGKDLEFVKDLFERFGFSTEKIIQDLDEIERIKKFK
ncbi:hypothetical protein WJR50_06610 [Catalinimonas sp. 4WD22]|uniref:hypothetical protein n=1 Tax=Catalinimonas locisalis TaxID=3133978 RepID=UPI003100CCA4